MKGEIKSTRFHERTKLEIPLEIDYAEDGEFVWSEQTATQDVTVCGIGFTVSQPVEPSRLVHLKMPLPKKFRLFDFGKDKYDVWGLARYVRLVPSDDSRRLRLKVGAALIGSSPPPSFLRDATTLYDLKPILRSGNFWDLRELPRLTGPYVRSAEERREIEIKVILETISDDGSINEGVTADTKNISESGMALTAHLGSENPRYVLVKTPDESLSLLAKTRGVHKLDSAGFARLHLQFISGKWSV